MISKLFESYLLVYTAFPIAEKYFMKVVKQLQQLNCNFLKVGTKLENVKMLTCWTFAKS